MFSELKFVKEITEIATVMYDRGYNEYNGGNISLLLDSTEMTEINETYIPQRSFKLPAKFPGLSGRYVAVTKSGSCFRQIKQAPERDIGILHISDDGAYAELMAGFSDGANPTSELVMHLGTHEERLKHDMRHRMVLHCHPADIIAMTMLKKMDSRDFTYRLWAMMTECAVIFPDGVGLIDWSISSSTDLGLKSAAYFSNYRAVVWAMHGITCVGSSTDEAFGLIEVINKAASIYLKVLSAGGSGHFGISEEQINNIMLSFNLPIQKCWLNKIDNIEVKDE